MILVDTGPLVALCDARDALHTTAARQLQTLASEELALCEPVLTEACFHLPHRAQRERLRAVIREFGMRPPEISDEEQLRVEVVDWLIKYADHQPDWADGWLAVLSGQSTGFKVWTYDREFRTTWRRPNGSRIPLAAPR